MRSRFLIDQLIFSVENSDINQIDKLKIVKVLLAIKIKLIEFSEKDIKVANKGLTPKESLRDPTGQAPNEAARAHSAPLLRTGQAKQGNGRPTERGRDHDRPLKPLKKYNLIIQFIKDKGGRVNAAELSSLGLAGRSLRRYIKNLCQENKIKIEKSGRNYFYSVI